MFDNQLFGFKNNLIGKMKPVTFLYLSNEEEKRYVISCNKGLSIQSLTGSTKNIKNETVNL